MVIPRYCPACGAERLKLETNKRWLCGACAFRYYHNVATAVAVVLRVEEAILLTERARDPQQGFLDFPGGFVDPEETLEDAAVRSLMRSSASRSTVAPCAIASPYGIAIPTRGSPIPRAMSTSN